MSIPPLSANVSTPFQARFGRKLAQTRQASPPADSLSIRFGNTGHTRLETPTRLETMVGSHRLIHQTELFRDDEAMGKLAKLLDQRFPDGVPIEIFAGSNGCDALSMAMLLLARYGPEKAKQYPLTTSDLMPDLFERSRAGIVGLLPNSLPDKPGEPASDPWQDLNARTSRLFEFVGAPSLRLKDLLEETPIPDDQYPEFRLKHSKHPRHNRERNWWTQSVDVEQLHRIRPEVKAQLDQIVRFESEPVDVLDTLVNNPPENSYDQPRVIFLKNMLYLLPQYDMTRLARTLGGRCKPGSVLVLGASEQSNALYDADRFLQMLEEGDWQRDEQDQNLWIKQR